MNRELAEILDDWLIEKTIKLTRYEEAGDARTWWYRPGMLYGPTIADSSRLRDNNLSVMSILANGTSVWVRHRNGLGSVEDVSEPHFFESLESRLRHALQLW